MVLEKYKKSQDKVGKSVNKEIAALANETFKKGVDKDHFKAMAEIVEGPENCPSLTKIRVNDLIWNLLSPPTRAFDEKMQVIQTGIAKARISMANVLDMIESQEHFRA